MANNVSRCTYYYVTVQDKPGEGFRLFSRLAELGVDLRAFTGAPVGPMRTQFTLFPVDDAKLRGAAEQARFTLDGPYEALLVQGDDEPGALAAIHQDLFEAGVNVYATTGVTDGKDGFGYVIYVQRGQFEKAAASLGV